MYNAQELKKAFEMSQSKMAALSRLSQWNSLFSARKGQFVDSTVAGNNFLNVVIRIEFAMLTL